ncbi:MAG: winged helix-turn-helix transcriptional regulator [Vicinamibacterales bacterium]
MPTISNDQYDRQILQAIASGRPLTQRRLSGELGVALGLTNLLIRRLATKGYIRVTGLGTRHVQYLMTPAGWEALGRATRASLENTIRLYTETREQIRAGLSEVARRSAADADGADGVVLYGAGDVGEIAYVSLQRTDLRVVGVIDDRRRGRFFDLTIRPSECLQPDGLDGVPYSYVIIASVRHADAIQARTDALNIPRNRVVHIAHVGSHA